LVLTIVVVWQDGNAVVRLIEVRVGGGVVDQKDVLHLTVFEGSEVFHIDSLLSLPAMRSEETMADELSLQI